MIGIMATRGGKLRTGCLVVAMALVVTSSASAQTRADALLEASRDGNARLATSLVQSGADVTNTGGQGDTALHWASYHGLLPLARLLIARGASVDARVRDGNTPLHQAAYRGHLEMVRLLVASGARVGLRNERGLTAVDWAARNGHDTVVRYLVSRGAVVDALHIGSGTPEGQGLQIGRGADGGPGSGASPPLTPAKGSLRGLSTRLGDLPPLVLRLPDGDPSPGATLGLTRNLDDPPAPAGRATARQTPSPRRDPLPGVWVQLGSHRAAAAAHAQWRRTLRAHPDLVSAFEPRIVAARVDARGTFHRLRIGPLPDADARRVCSELQSRRTACLVVSDVHR